MKTNGAQLLQRYGLTAVIVVAIVGSLGVIGWETGWGRYFVPGVPKVDGSTRKADEIALLPTFSLPPVDPAYKETVERPLFNQSRRPNPPAPPPEAAKPTMEKGKYRLTGTAVNAELSTAFLVDNRTGKTFRVSKGTPVDPLGSQPIVLDNVDTRSATLRLGTDTEMLTLVTSKSAAAPPPQLAQPPQAGMMPNQGLPPGTPQPAIAAGSVMQPAVPQPNAPVFAGASPVPVPTPLPVPGAIAGQTIQPGPAQGANSFGPAGAFTGSANPAVVPTPDPNATALRRRRFQNLPQ
jgi:hypothetical protein